MALRLRLLLAVAVTAFIALLGSAVATYSAFQSYLDHQLDETLQSSAVALVTCLDAGGQLSVPLVAESGPGITSEVVPARGTIVDIGPPTRSGKLSRGPRLSKEALSQARRLVRSEGELVSVPDDCSGGSHDDHDGSHGGGHAPPGPGNRDHDDGSHGRLGAASYLSVGGTRSYRVRLSHLENGAVLALAIGLAPTHAALGRLVVIELAVSGGALLLVIALGFALVRVGLEPLGEVEDTAEKVMAGDLSARVPGHFRPGTEIARLAGVLNLMIGRLSSDIDELSKAEASLRESESRMREFLADASHELRTPISAISGYAELFSRGAGERPEDLERVLAGIERETGRMARLVSDIMLLASLEEGRPLERRPVELVALAAEAIHASAAIGPEWPVVLVAADSVEVEGDELRLRQVLDNLLGNVRAHTPPGTRTTVRVERRGGDGLITVEDRGPGLPPEGLARIFERFAREDTSRARESGGAGLGLSIVRAIVRAHEGTIEATATEGGGVTFLVRLPAAVSEQAD